MIAKKIAVVPMNTSRSSRLGITHIWKGGPPAWAIWLVKPVAIPNRLPTQAGGSDEAAIRPPPAPGGGRAGGGDPPPPSRRQPVGPEQDRDGAEHRHHRAGRDVRGEQPAQ